MDRKRIANVNMSVLPVLSYDWDKRGLALHTQNAG